MADDFLPSDFDTAGILAGLHTAMAFGRPTRTEDVATFYLPLDVDPVVAPLDDSGVPFDPSEQHSHAPPKLAVPCAVEFYDAAGVIETFGSASPTRIKITLLDPDYQQVKDFIYVVAGGDKYMRSKIEPPIALGTIDVWMCWADSENER